MIKCVVTSGLLGLSLLTLPFSLNATVLPKIKSTKNNSHTKESIDCPGLIKQFETEYEIPENLLAAVAKIESSGNPWSVNARGRSYNFTSKVQAIDFITRQKQRGTKNIYVGCMQICLKSHGKRFHNIDHALTPYNNIRYAAKLLRGLFDRFGSWESAIMHYNASSRKVSYKNRVLAIWGGNKADLLSTSFANNTTSAIDSIKKEPHIKIGFGPGIGMRSRENR